ncbi:TetR family transcriptional regulator [Nocardia sp. SYP-A9097]|uniref:TetR/AcrR family transcriptional regulator n=1 Tax=Nocardia sp. SYP-A9097 TaxID=2663237 RepID=UPI00129A2AA3|nr:TetR/AcrR family transcriptional regulator C-terminal domain-containing protein [Nocardia sp. SYP-A9097]MRH90561.1 TetR family transcriptional regulator [Nocardia sp. SYP-A9097]
MLDNTPQLVWSRDRRTPARRAPSVDRIVGAALTIADSEGLEAVSMRRVATELASGTASLYRYVANRDELVDLMVDTAQGEIAVPELTGDWRTDIAAVAHQLRATLLQHPWLGAELSGRPALGPNALRRHDIALAALTPLTGDITLASNIADAVTSYVFGAVNQELAELRAHHRTGLTEEQWRATVGPYLREAIATGDYPHFARRVIDAEDTIPPARFDFGLDCLLEGVSRTA